MVGGDVTTIDSGQACFVFCERAQAQRLTGSEDLSRSMSLRTVASAPLYCKKEGERGCDAGICTKDAYRHRHRNCILRQILIITRLI